MEKKICYRHLLKATAIVLLVFAAECLVFWPSIRWLWARFLNAPLEAMPLALTGLVTAAIWIANRQGKIAGAHLVRENIQAVGVFCSNRLGVLAAINFGYMSLDFLGAPPIFLAAFMCTSCLVLLYRGLFAHSPPLAFYPLLLLSLPILPSLQFYLGYPARVLCAHFTAALLQLNGFNIVREGTLLNHQGHLVYFDAPCSGITMLWANYYCAAAVAFIFKLPPGRIILAFSVAGLTTMIANILRSSSLFVIEQLAAFNHNALLHYGVGVTAFLLALGLTLSCLLYKPIPLLSTGVYR